MFNRGADVKKAQGEVVMEGGANVPVPAGDS